MQSAPPALSERFRDAAALAHEVHGSQRRAGTQIPYLAHLLVVTGLVIEDGGDEDQALAAMLHDAVEDGGGRSMLERIAQTFGLRRRPGPLTEDLRRAVDEPTDLFARDGHQTTSVRAWGFARIPQARRRLGPRRVAITQTE